MNNNQINLVLNNLQLGSVFRTPDNFKGVNFTIANVTPNEIKINLSSGNEMSISRNAFLAVNDYRQINGHTINNPVKIGSNNDKNASGGLCLASRTQNNDVRCVNYIVPILNHFGAVGFSGSRPNTCWFI